jgi:enoyl-CoA hydratase
MNDLVAYRVSHHVAYLEIRHPPANTLSEAALKSLTQAVERVEEDAAVRAAVITGAGKFFVSGADIKEMAQKATEDEGFSFAALGQDLFNRIEGGTKPFIAAINGACFGGGLELARACHLRYAAKGAKLGQPEINLGLIPGFGGTQRLPRLIGRSAALEMLLTGEAITAEEARNLGLIHRVVSADDLLPAVADLAEQLAQKGRLATKFVLEAVCKGNTLPFEEGLRLEAQNFGRAFASDEKREGVAAFLEKRKPRFHDV